MALTWLHHWMRGSSSRRSAHKPTRRRSALLRVEALEERTVPAIHRWTGLGSNNNWTTAANWDIGAPNSPDDILVFPLGALRTTNVNNFPLDTEFAGLRFEGGGFTISGNRLRLGAQGITTTGGSTLIQMDLQLTSLATPIDVTGTLQIGNATAGSISGPRAGFVKDGPGTLILGRANSYSGQTRVTEGILNIQNSTALGGTDTTLLPGNTIVTAGAVLELQGGVNVTAEELRLGDGALTAGTLRSVSGTNTWGGKVILNSTATIDVRANALTISGVISSPGVANAGLTKEGPGTLTLAGSQSNTYTGVTTLNDGTLQLDKQGGFIPTAVPAGLVVAAGRVSLLGGVVRYLNGGPQIEGPITVNRFGILDINNQSTFLSQVTLNGGSIQIGSSGLLALNNVTATSVGNTPASIQGTALGGLQGTVRFTVQDGPAEVDLNVPAQFGEFFQSPWIKDGPGRMQVSGANLNTDAITIEAGTLRITNPTALGPAGSAQTEVKSGGTLEVIRSAGGSLSFDVDENLILAGAGAGNAGALVTQGTQGIQNIRFLRPVTLTGNTTVRTDGNTDGFTFFNAALSGDFDLTKTGDATLALGAANPGYGGLTIVLQGVLEVRDAAQGLGSSAAGDGTVVRSGATLSFGNGSSAEPLTLNGAGAPGLGVRAAALRGLGVVTLTGPITLASNTTIGGAGDGDGVLNLAGAISGPFDLTVVTDTVIFSGTQPNTYGTTQVLGRGNLTLNKSPNTNAIPGALIIQRDAQANLSGVVFVKSPEQIPDTAPITIDGGILLPDADETIGPLTLNNGTVTPSGTPTTLLTLKGDVSVSGNSFLEGNVSLGSTTRTFTVASGGKLIVTGGLSGGGGLIKAGPGTMELRGTNSFTGATAVNEGILFVGQDITSPVTVNAGATLTGNSSGFFTGEFGDITVAGGTLNPGNDPFLSTPAGIMKATGAASLNSASTFHVDIGGTTPGSNGHDQLNLQGNGTINLGNARLDVAFFGGFQSAVGNTYTIVKNDTSNPINGFFTDAAGAVIPQGGEIVVNGVRLRINYSGGDFNDVVLTHISSPSAAEDLAITPPVIAEGGIVELTGRLTDPDQLDTLTLEVDWGDGSALETFTDIGRGEFRIPHQYLEAGRYTVRLSWRDEAGGGNSQELTVTVVDRVPGVVSVVINDGSAQRSKVTSITVTFTDIVTLAPGAFELRRQGGNTVNLQVATSVVNDRTVAVLTFTGPDIIGGSLADGNYTLTINSALVHDNFGQALDGDGDGVLGGDRVDSFFRLFGDADGDRDVDRRDLALFRSTFRKRAGDPGFLAFFDFDGDGDVDRRDQREFNKRRGRTLRA
ncbi:MAG TPA: autotransporter-associated beta strand repeat-containing protein [Gemmataceae bacterium]|nr:autotransporter-associated beta strand repeat-containing protein [Gemmataceae bacterium]